MTRTKKDAENAKIVDLVATLIKKTEKRFRKAQETAPKQRANLVFKVELDGESELPAVAVTISFGERHADDGMKVRSTYSRTISENIDDPEQPPLGTIIDETSAGTPQRRLFDAPENGNGKPEKKGKAKPDKKEPEAKAKKAGGKKKAAKDSTSPTETASTEAIA